MVEARLQLRRGNGRIKAIVPFLLNRGRSSNTARTGSLHLSGGRSLDLGTVTLFFCRILGAKRLDQSTVELGAQN